MSSSTPLMDQYQKIKNEHKDKILFFRMGDFFEMFDKDAEIAAPLLNIALTYRNKKAGLKTKMCGLPHHSISGPIAKLLSAGLSVAICDQIEPASLAKGLVKRAVTRVLSPGMVYDLDTLDQFQANYMAAFDKNYISFLDLSTGLAFYYEKSDELDFFRLLDQFQPKELVVTSLQKEKCSSSPFFQSFALSLFDPSLQKSLMSQILQKYKSHPESAQRLLYYVYQTQGEENLKIISSFEKRGLSDKMYCSRQLFSHLEVFKSYEGSVKNTLFSAVNRTKTPNGARLLKSRLESPLIDKAKIEEHWDQIELWMSKTQLLDSTRKILSQMGDGERKLGKMAQNHCQARDILSVAFWLDGGFKIHDLLKDNSFVQEVKTARALRDKIKHIISPSCPISLKEGGLINKGVNPQLDKWLSFGKKSQSHLLEMEQREREKLGIPSLKIRYNGVFGYYIEIRKIHSAKIPSHYRRKQTLVHAERYTTEELNLLEEKILSARSQQIEMEYQIFKDLRSEVIESLSPLIRLCRYWGELDLYSSLAFLAMENNYVRPQFAPHLKLTASRHPVLEQKSFHEFVPNTLELAAHQTLILTGPNMAGKSTLMRQVALTVLLAQSGCFVPADKAELPLFKKMFTRIGASDFLSKGLSTFMVEMKETAEILEKADESSLIILDEIGRGTATFDGMSLAQAILEFLTEEKRPLLLSATHYHELTQLAHQREGFLNGSMAIREEGGGIHFLYCLKKGSAGKSYGVQVARLAGLPSCVVRRAESLLLQRESLSSQSAINKESFKEKQTEPNKTTSLPLQALMKEILEYSLMTQSPIDAMNQIKKWQDRLSSLIDKKDGKALKTKPPRPMEQDLLPDILN